MKPSVTMSTKISVVTAQKMNVCCGLAGPNSPMLNDPCQTTSTTDNARTKKPKPGSSRFFICGDIYSIIRGSGPWDRYRFLRGKSTSAVANLFEKSCAPVCGRVRDGNPNTLGQVRAPQPWRWFPITLLRAYEEFPGEEPRCIFLRKKIARGRVLR